MAVYCRTLPVADEVKAVKAQRSKFSSGNVKKILGTARVTRCASAGIEKKLISGRGGIGSLLPNAACGR